MVAAFVNLATFIASVPVYWTQLNTVCAVPSEASCNFSQLNLAETATLERLGVAIDTYAAYTLTIHTITSLSFFVVGFFIFWRRSGDWYGLFVSLLLIAFGAMGPSAVFNSALTWAYPDLSPVADTVGRMLFPVLGLFLVTFPDGRFVPRWSPLIVFLWLVQALFFEKIAGWPAPLFGAELLLVWGGTLAVQVYRYRRVSTPAQRQQTKWVLFGFALGVSTIVASIILSATVPGYGKFDGILEGTWVSLLFTPIPLSIGIAMLRFRLWDIDPIINRALVYGALTASVVGIYILVVGYFGTLLRVDENLFVSLIATGIVAVLFAPLRHHLQRGVNRLMYGERDDPYAVISRLGERLEGTLAPESVLPTVVRTVREALKLPYAAIALREGEDSAVAAETGSPVDEPLRLPLIHQGETIGELILAPRASGEEFTPADRRLLEDLARQAGIAAYTVRLTTDLQRSRERLVSAREEERRRMRRDLHDGLGPMLGSLTLKLDVADDLVESDPVAARALIRGLKAQSQSAVTDIRRLVYALRPPALDDLGLVGAIRETAAQYGANGLLVSVEIPKELPPLPAAVEVAAYRIAQEAMTNVARHAAATKCSVSLTLDEETGMLRLEIADDGRGLSRERGPGVGLSSMRERAEELGGSCVVESPPGGGTRARASLPCVSSTSRPATETRPSTDESMR